MSEKYLREIEEILKEAEKAPPHDRQDRAEVAAPPQPPSSGRYVLRPPRLGPARGLSRISAGKVMLGAFALFLLAAVFNWAGGPTMLFIWLGLGLFVVGYALFFARPRGPKLQKRWRGRLMEDEPPEAWRRFTRWMKG